MNKAEAADARKRLTLSLAVLALLGTAIFLPLQFRSEASTQDKQETAERNIFHRTESHEPGLENYDIRTVKSEEVTEALLRFRTDAGTSAYAIADKRENFVRGETDLRTRVSTLKVEYNSDLMVPEVISPDVWNAKIESLSGPSNMKRSEILRSFIKQNSSLIGIDDRQADSLKVLADYENPAGNMSFAHLEQRIDGIPVFRGEIKAGFRKDGSIIRVINNLAPGIDSENLSRNFGNPVDAVRAAAGNINVEVKSLDLEPNQAISDDNKKVFGRGPSATTAERMYFPTEIGVARPAWRVLIWQPVNAYYVIVDAETGITLWRKNITEDQTQSATFEVYRNSNAFMDAAESPAPLTPGPIDPGLGTQGALLTRENVSLIGNEGPLSFNNNGWITDGANGTDGWTDGNATEAGLDIDGTDGVDAPMLGTGRAFASAWNPPPGNPAPGDIPSTADAQFGAVVQMFYVMNRYHDAMYQLGFTEDAFNFQDDNFGRGGAAGDRIRSEGQDSSGTNNANFSTPADGGRGRMQMFRFTGMDPDRDGTADADIIIHEATHGTSNRLHGNASGLGTNMARGMGEGWSDFYAHSLLAEPTDPINGIYTTGGYATLEIAPGFTGNFYYGIRRFPKAVIAFTGGPGNLPHNPLTFADLNAGCDLTDGAFPRGPIGSATCDQVHNAGEVWSSALWEIRALMVTRLGFAAGTQRVLQVVTDGMKLAPLNPTFLQERDAIIAAASALPALPEASADVVDVREGFRRRGMGFSAEVLAASPANVVEAFDFPNVRYTDPFSVSDSTGDNDGFPEPGENVLLSIAVENTTGAAVTNVSVSVNGQASVNYGNINDGQTVTQDIPYAIPSSLGGTACGAFHNVEIVVSSDEGVQAPVDKQFRLGAPVGGPAQTFESTDGPIDLPTSGTTSGPSDPYPTVIDVAGLSGNKVVKVELTNVDHTWVDDLDFMLESPAGDAYIFLSDSFGNTDAGPVTITVSDGGADGPAPDGGPWAPGDYQPANPGAGDPFDGPAPAPTGDAANGDTFLSTFGMDGSAMNGQWKLWIDDDAGGDSGSMAGWKITFESDDYVCNLAAGVARADFDGDGRTDVSVFRPSEGNWYINGSTSGFFGLNWGLAGDVLVPADYDGDGVTDVAVARMTDDEGQADFYIINSETLTFTGYSWGQTGDIPVAGDYDGDGEDDVTVYRPSDNTWYTALDNGTALIRQFGGAGDIPVVGDFDGDGTDDLATWNAGVINAQLSGGGNLSHNVGGNMNVSGDYDGDGKHDTASYDTSTGEWRIWMSLSDTLETYQFGVGTDTPAPGDYDGDGKQDLAIYRNGEWWIFNSFSGNVSVFAFGVGGDSVLPLASAP